MQQRNKIERLLIGAIGAAFGRPAGIGIRSMAVVAALAVWALGATCGAASAVEPLPEFTVLTNWTGTTGRVKLETVGKTSISCTSATSSGEIAKAHEGTFSFDLKECTGPLGSKCNSRGDAAGIILLTGNFDLVRDFWTEAVGALLLLFTEAHVECGISSVTLKGDVVAPIGPGDETTTKYTLTLKEAGGVQGEVRYYNEGEEVVTPSAPFLASINGGAFEGAAVEAVEATLTTAQATQDNVGPIVVPLPNVWTTSARVGARTSRTVTYDVLRGSWRPNGRVFTSLRRGSANPFGFSNGINPCTGTLTAGQFCEVIVTFTPTRAETYEVWAAVSPFARPMTLIGTGE